MQEPLGQIAEPIANEIMSDEVDRLCEATGSRRNCYRERRLDTCMGKLTFRIPKLKTGSLFPDDAIKRCQR